MYRASRIAREPERRPGAETSMPWIRTPTILEETSSRCSSSCCGHSAEAQATSM